jgi:hypothetical protein
MSTLAVNTITNAAGGNTAQINGMTPTADSLQGFRNRIINGGMQVNQRGGIISATGLANTYGVDRFAIRTTSGSAVVSMQQSTVAPVGFYNSLLCTVTTADASLAANDLTVLHQKIEGVNVVDLGWGTANAQPVTISFQVRSNVTGTYGVGVQNSDSNRSYPSTFTINAADTWETKTLTIPGDTTGTWNIGTTSTALYLFFSLSAGSDFTGGTTNAWNAADRRGASGQVNWAATLNNTFYITGVQLETGSVATPFERRPYGTELALCQRYYQILISAALRMYINNVVRDPKTISPEMRATPTLTKSFPAGSTNIVTDSSTASTPRVWQIDLQISGFGVGVIDTPNYTVLASAEL